MPNQSSKLRPFREPPLRAFAREAVTLANEDIVTGVLLERIAQYLCTQLRCLHGKPTAALADVPVGERNQMMQYAIGIFGLVQTIEHDAPPSDAEIRRYIRGRQLTLARGRVRCQAVTFRHRLSVWRPDADRHGYELAVCERCGAGASIHVDTARESLSEPLLALCREWRPSPFSTTGAQNHG